MTGPRRTSSVLLGALTLVLVLAACTQAGGAQPPKSAGRPSSARSTAPAPISMPGMKVGSAAAVPTSPTELRLRLEELLGEHAILMVRRMRGSIDGERQFIDAAQGVLDENTNELVAAVSSVYGSAVGAQFRRSWQDHIGGLIAYSDALARRDVPAEKKARAALAAYVTQYGTLIATATHGRLQAAAVSRDVAAHVDHLLMQVDAYAQKDYPRAFALEREAYAMMFSTGKVLAGAMATTRPSGELPAGFDSTPERLRSALGMLLGEHAELAFDATRAVVAGSPTAVPAAQTLDENTRDIIAAMQAALGQAAAQKFGAVWADHIDALVAFAVAVAKGDDVGQAAARRRLDAFPAQLGALLTPLAAGRVQEQTVLAAMREHDAQLLQQVTAYAARDYPHAQDIAYAGYAHMFAIATTLAAVLEGRASSAAPLGGAATGGGWLARHARAR